MPILIALALQVSPSEIPLFEAPQHVAPYQLPGDVTVEKIESI